MKQENKHYEKWLTDLKSSQPVLQNPEELTAAIMQQVSKALIKKKKRTWLIGAWSSGIAATFLLCMLINDICFSPAFSPMVEQSGYEYWQNSTSLSLPENWNDMKLLEKNSYLSSRYAQSRQLRQAMISEFANKMIK